LVLEEIKLGVSSFFFFSSRREEEKRKVDFFFLSEEEINFLHLRWRCKKLPKEIDTNTLYEPFVFNDMLCQLSSGLIVSSKSDKPKLKRLTKFEQAQYVLPEKLILVGLILADL